MKCSLIAVLLALAPLSAAAGTHDVSLWTRVNNGGVTHIPWYTYSQPGKPGLSSFALDLRYNLDRPEAFGGFAGVPITKGKLCITPYVGVIFGSEGGLSLQVTTAASSGKFNSYTLNQYAVLERSEHNFAYHYGHLMVPTGKRFAVGVSEQVFKESGNATSVDIGPTVKVTPGRGLYAKVWLSVAPTNDWDHKVFIGIGFVR